MRKKGLQNLTLAGHTKKKKKKERSNKEKH